MRQVYVPPFSIFDNAVELKLHTDEQATQLLGLSMSLGAHWKWNNPHFYVPITLIGYELLVYNGGVAGFSFWLRASNNYVTSDLGPDMYVYGHPPCYST
jgi:hypothetical protein